MDRRRFLSLGAGATALSFGLTSPSLRQALAQGATDLASLGLPELTVTQTDEGYSVSPATTPAGWTLLTFENQLSAGDSLGNNVTWPVEDTPSRFVHVKEDGELSTALTDFFLPHREGVLEDFLAAHADGNTCSTPTTSAALAVESDEAVPTLGGATTH